MDQEITIKSIGHVRCGVREPRDENWGDILARIELHREYSGALAGLADFSHALVICYLHRAVYKASEHLQRRPRGDAGLPKVGIFSQRVKDRPNPLGVTAVEIVGVGNDYLEVRGLDAIDTTPVVDIKPYFPQFDQISDARVPDWVNRLMQGYF